MQASWRFRNERRQPKDLRSNLESTMLDKIRASGQGRIVNVSSLGHVRGKMEFDDLQQKKDYGGQKAYRQSKLANVYFTRHLAQLLKQNGEENLIKVCSLHPGVVRTELGRYMFEGRFFYKVFVYTVIAPFFYLFTKSPWWGAQTSLHCCLCPFEELQSGLYYSDCVVKAETFVPQWEGEAKKLQEWSEEAVKEYL